MYFLLYICRKLRYYREQLLNFIQICDEESRKRKIPERSAFGWKCSIGSLLKTTSERPQYGTVIPL